MMSPVTIVACGKKFRAQPCDPDHFKDSGSSVEGYGLTPDEALRDLSVALNGKIDLLGSVKTYQLLTMDYGEGNFFFPSTYSGIYKLFIGNFTEVS